MRTIKILSFIFVALMVACTSEEGVKNTMPTKLTINIPDNLSTNVNSTSRSSRSVQSDTLDGAETYELLRAFIHIGEGAAEMVDAIASGLHQHKIDRAMEVSYNGDDARRKKMIVEEDMDYQSETWDLKMTVVDKELNDTAMQLWWNEDGERGICIMKPYQVDRIGNAGNSNLMYKIDYSEEEDDYDARMIVSITGEKNEDEWGIDKLKFFVGQKGDEFELYGNSNHPNVSNLFQSYTDGANYAFAARSNESDDQAVAQIALPPSTLTHSDVFEEYGVKEVLMDEIINALQAEGTIDTTGYGPAQWQLTYAYLESIMINVESPAYFNTAGFISAGALPSGFDADFADLSALIPYVPNDVLNLEIKFE